jgi:hypothetical protein
VFLFSINRFVGRYNFAQVTMQSISENLAEGWEFDRDEFPTNNFAHPWHGATYHTSGRASGFNFYESYVFDFVGSLTYELFTETTKPSMNDLITTSLGGAIMGEMFHRLYTEANSPFAFLISPMDSVTNLVTRRKPQKTGGKNLYRLAVSAGPGWTNGAKYNTDENLFREGWNALTFNVNCDVIYRNPFVQQSWIPYEHFELNFGGGLGKDFEDSLWWDLYVKSDGYLFSFTPVETGKNRLSTGLSLCYDFFSSPYDFFTRSNINFFSQAFDWAVKYQRLLAEDSRLEIKAHLGWIGFGGSLFYNDDMLNKDRAIYPDYGTGANARLFFSYFGPRSDRLSLEFLLFGIYTISYYRAEMAGWELYGVFNASYAFPLGKHLFLNIGDSFSGKAGLYEIVPGLGQWSNSVKVFVEWSFFQKI